MGWDEIMAPTHKNKNDGKDAAGEDEEAGRTTNNNEFRQDLDTTDTPAPNSVREGDENYPSTLFFDESGIAEQTDDSERGGDGNYLIVPNLSSNSGGNPSNDNENHDADAIKEEIYALKDIVENSFKNANKSFSDAKAHVQQWITFFKTENDSRQREISYSLGEIQILRDENRSLRDENNSRQREIQFLMDENNSRQEQIRWLLGANDARLEETIFLLRKNEKLELILGLSGNV
eukprot:scaffold5539_cov81-Skeletonema_menzelii.AAC.19